MIPVMQTRDGWPRGNCVMACVASILEVPLDALPDLYEEGERRGSHEDWWWGILLETLRAHGLHCEEGEPGDWRFPEPPRGYAIASMEIPGNGGHGHAVVVCDGAIVHDPHPLQPSKIPGARIVHWWALTPVARMDDGGLPTEPGEIVIRPVSEGSHTLLCYFACPLRPGHTCRVPLAPGNPHGWQWDGNTERPTLTPSIHCLSEVNGQPAAGCGWHGHITAGALTPA